MEEVEAAVFLQRGKFRRMRLLRSIAVAKNYDVAILAE